MTTPTSINFPKSRKAKTAKAEPVAPIVVTPAPVVPANGGPRITISSKRTSNYKRDAQRERRGQLSQYIGEAPPLQLFEDAHGYPLQERSGTLGFGWTLNDVEYQLPGGQTVTLTLSAKAWISHTKGHEQLAASIVDILKSKGLTEAQIDELVPPKGKGKA